MTQWYTRAAAKGVAVSGHFWQPYGLVRMTTNCISSNRDELDAIFKQKRTLRTQLRKTLKAIDPSLRSQQGTIQSNLIFGRSSFYSHTIVSCSDNAIQDIILGAPWFKSSLRFCAYISCSALREVDTFKLLSHILQPQPNGMSLNNSFSCYLITITRKLSLTKTQTLTPTPTYVELEHQTRL